MIQKKGWSWLCVILGLVWMLGFSACAVLAPQGEKSDPASAVSVEKTQAAFNSTINLNTIPRLTGVNWFGFETSGFAPHGLWSRDYKSMLKQIKDLGFNCVRLPWCNAMIGGSPNGIQINADGVDAYTGIKGMNTDLAGLSSLQVMDKIIAEAMNDGIYIILDNHSKAADGYMNETLWYTTAYPEEKWISDWVMMVNRYKTYPNVVGADLKNEPHGNMSQGMKPPATWGYDQSGYNNTDFRKAAAKCGQAILAANPNMIIVVEGTEEYKGETYWWGGNLKGVKDYPITEVASDKLLYSAHEYGPEVYNQSWFSASDFPNNMPGIWDANFWYVTKSLKKPLFFGEFGIKEDSAANSGSVAYKWITSFMAYVGKKSHWTFWCMNPNSGDTGGILKDDWVSVNTAKYNILKPYLNTDGSPLIIDGSSSSSSVVSSSSSSKSSSSSVVSSSSSSVVSSSSSSLSSSSSSKSSSSSSSSSSSAYTPKTAPFSFDGAGEFYWSMTSIPSFINSWNLDALDINGISFVNKWASVSQLPAKQDGYYYIHYKGLYPWSHFEAK